MKRLPTAVAISLLGALACSQPVSASDGPAYGHDQQKPPKAGVGIATASATGPGAIASATATCPRGSRAIGGGFRAPSSIAVIGVPFESVKVGQRSWRASMQLLDIGSPSTLALTVQVNCRAKAPSTRTASATVPTDGSSKVGPTATAACPGNRRVVAGGFTMPPPLINLMATSLVFDSHRAGARAWTTRVATGAAAPSTITTEAYCTTRRESFDERSSVSAPNAEEFGLSSALASCNQPPVPFAGGFSQPASDIDSFLVISESISAAGGWQASGIHSGTDPAVTLSAHVYCGRATTGLPSRRSSVRRKLVVPLSEDAEGGPEALLRSLLVE
jgi:hypothetical protein